MAVEVVAAASGAEHCRVPFAAVEPDPRHVQSPLAAGDGIPYDEVRESVGAREESVEEDAAVAGVEREQAAVVALGRTEGCGGEEASDDWIVKVAEESQHGRRPVERAEAAEEGGVG